MSIILAIEPLPCPRPRIALRGRIPVAYYPAAYAKWKVEAAKLLHCDEPPLLTSRLAVDCTFYVTKPRTTKLSGPKPDIDNYVKSLLDALTLARYWIDDSQVVFLSARKMWTSGAGRIEFTITEEPT
jgi:Holliday junction resolvase RusA-like endonuclease